MLWERGDYSPWTYNVRIGTLDLPSLFEPDLHIFIEGKIDWLVLPEGARTLKGDMVRAKHWPKDSLARQEASKRRFEALKRRQDEKTVEHSESKKGKEQAEQVDDGENGQEEKTPTNGSPEPRGDDDEDEEDDEEYERRTDAIEKALQERLAQLTLKLSNQEKSQS